MKEIKLNKRYFILVAAVLATFLLITASVVLYFWLKPLQKYAAKVGSKEISKVSYEGAIEKCEGFSKFNQSTDINCKEESLNDLILKESLKQEAEKRNITISDDEIAEKLKQVVEPYGSEDEYFKMVSAAYGWDKEYVQSNLVRDILKEKLENSILRNRQVLGLYFRYDWEGKVDETRELENKKLATDTVTKNYLIPLQNGSTEAQLSAIVKNVTASSPDPGYENITGFIIYKDVNSSNAEERFADNVDWEEINELSKSGEVTPTFLSEGGYAVAYRLESIGEGNYNTWDEYLNALMENKTIKKQSLKLMINNFIAALGIKNAIAAKINCSENHFSALYGTLVDGGNTSLKISGATISGAHGSTGTYPKCNTTEKGSDSVSSGSNGKFTLGKVKDKTYAALSCFVRWDVAVKHSYYETVSYGERSVYGNGISTPLDHNLNAHGKTGETYSGSYESENTDGDGLIYMKIKTYNLAVNVSPAGVATPTGAGVKNAGVKVTAGYTNMNSSYDFQNWSGDCDSAGSVLMNSNKSCTANFTLKPPLPISCVVSPRVGVTPLVVNIIISGGVAPYDYQVEADQPFLRTNNGNVYYTYNTAGQKTITVRDANGTIKPCTPNIVSVTSPNTNSGGEVAP